MTRAQLHGEHTRGANRIHKVLQDANIKLSSVATDILGKSGRDVLVAGQDDPAAMAELARGKLRKEIRELTRALKGHVMEHHQIMLEQLLDHLALLEEQVSRFNDRIAEGLRPFLDEETFNRLARDPGGEPGHDRERGGGNWCGHEPVSVHGTPGVVGGPWSGQRGVGRQTQTEADNQRQRVVATGVVRGGLAAGRSKDTYFAAQYRRLAGRRGKNRAVMAVAHSLLVVFYHLLNKDLQYQELGGNHFDTLDPTRLRRHLVKRLESLGYEVTLTARKAALTDYHR